MARCNFYIFLCLTIGVILYWQPAYAAPPRLPFTVYGVVSVNGEPVADGVELTATIEICQAETCELIDFTTETYTNNELVGFYFFRILSDDPDTSVYEGGRTGDQITFSLEGDATIETVTQFERGGFQLLDLDGLLNVAPVAADDTYKISEDDSIQIFDVLLNDTDANEDELTIQNITQPTNGVVENQTTQVSYRPNSNFHGEDIFTYIVSDGVLTDTATVTVTVNSVNDVPVAIPDHYTVDENDVLVVSADGVLTNDTDIDAEVLTATVVTEPAHGELSLQLDGSFLFTPTLEFFGETLFTYQANDNVSASAITTVTIDVNFVNNPPITVNDTYTMTEDTQLSVAASGVLANDVDADDHPLTASLVSEPDEALTFEADGAFVYTPPANFNGTMQFRYVATDGIETSAPATVTIHVTPVNDEPTISPIEHQTVDEDGTVGPIPFTIDDVETDAAALALAANSSNAVLLEAGGIVFGGSGRERTVRLTPATDQAGTVVVTLGVNDGSVSAETTFTLTVTPINDPPTTVSVDNTTIAENQPIGTLVGTLSTHDADVDDTHSFALISGEGDTDNNLFTVVDNRLQTNAVFDFESGSPSRTMRLQVTDAADATFEQIILISVTDRNDAPVATPDTYAVDENSILTVSADGVLTNDTDADGDVLTATIITEPNHGVLTFQPDGSFVFTPTLEFVGETTFTYQATDDVSASATTTVTIAVNFINNPPTASNDTYTTTEDTQLAVAALGVLANDTDVDGQTLAAVLTSRPNGTFTFNAAGSFVYDPPLDFNGTVQFRYAATDGIDASAPAIVTIHVEPVNDEPTIPVIADQTIDEDVTLGPIPLVIGDVETDAADLTLTASSSNSALLAASGIVLGGSGGERTMQLTPTADQFGTTMITLAVDDGMISAETTFTLTVTPVNDAPSSLSIDNTTVAENQPFGTLVGTLSTTDIDSADTHTFTLVAGEGDTDNAWFTIIGNTLQTAAIFDFESGNPSRTLRVRVADSAGATFEQIIAITITDQNDAPVASPDFAQTAFETGVTIDVLANDTDPDNDALLIASVQNPLNGSAEIISGSLRYTPTIGFDGTDVVSYTVSDGNGGTDSSAVTLLVEPPDSADVTLFTDIVTTTEGTSITISVLANDAASVPLTLVYVGRPTDGTTTQIGNQVLFIPDLEFNGVATFTYAAEAAGGLGGGSETVVIHVLPVNDAPQAENDTAFTNEETAIVINVLDNDQDVDAGDVLRVASAEHGANGFVSLNADERSVTYSPDTGFFGADQFTYQVHDGNGGTDSGTVFVTVDELNRRPIGVPDAATTIEDTPIEIHVIENDLDPNTGDAIQVVSITQPQNGIVALLSDGRVNYTPIINFSGVDNFGYIIRDNAGLTASASVVITVEAAIDPPIANPAVAAGEENEPINDIKVLDNVANIDDEPLVIENYTQPESSEGESESFDDRIANDRRPTSCGVVTLNSADNTFDFTPDPAFSGSCAFDYTVGLLGNQRAQARTDAERTSTVTLIVGEIQNNLAAQDDYITIEENTQITIDLLQLVSGDDLNSLKLVGVQSKIGAVISNGDGSVDYIPPVEFSGADTITYTIANDSGGLATAVIHLTVNAVNRAPSATADRFFVLEDMSLTVDVLANDIDKEGGTLTVTELITPSVGSVLFSAENQLIYTPPADYAGTDNFGYIVVDPHGAFSVGSVTMVITNVNDIPVARDDIAFVIEDTPTIINVLGNDRDADQDLLNLVAGAPEHGTVSTTISRTLIYTPAHNFNGSDVLTYTVTDGQGGTAQATLTITVQPVNDAPLAATDYVTVTAGLSVTIPVLSNDSDLDSTQLYILSASSDEGQIIVNGREIIYIANADSVGVETATYLLADEDGGVTTGQIIINVLPDVDVIYTVFFPLIMERVVQAPDLIVEQIAVTDEGIAVTVRNVGNAETNKAFWIDFYIDPLNAPQRPNETFVTTGGEGFVWYIAKSLLPNESHTLHFGSGTHLIGVGWNGGILTAGTQLFVQVDSADTSTTYGAIHEQHEIIGEPYNNITTRTLTNTVIIQPARHTNSDMLLPVRPDGIR